MNGQEPACPASAVAAAGHEQFSGMPEKRCFVAATRTGLWNGSSIGWHAPVHDGEFPMPALPLLSLLQATADPTTRPANGRLCMAIASAIMLVAPSHAIGQPVCKPALVIKQAGLSAPFNLQRIWRAAITVDASQCATNTGLFSVWFIRGIENGPDMAFAEPFIWHDGDIVIRVDFWHDESVVDSQLADVAACRCREGGNATRSSAPR